MKNRSLNEPSLLHSMEEQALSAFFQRNTRTKEEYKFACQNFIYMWRGEWQIRRRPERQSKEFYSPYTCGDRITLRPRKKNYIWKLCIGKIIIFDHPPTIEVLSYFPRRTSFSPCRKLLLVASVRLKNINKFLIYNFQINLYLMEYISNFGNNSVLLRVIWITVQSLGITSSAINSRLNSLTPSNVSENDTRV